MAEKTDISKRKLYKISHLTEMLGITSRTIRYYDQFGLMPHVKRTSGNMRLFDEDDVELIKTIRHLQKKEFLPLDVIRERLFGQGKKSGDELVVVTDSLVSLPPETIKAFDIQVVPFKIMEKKRWVNDQFLHGKVHSKPDRHQLIKAPTIDDYLNVYQKLAEKGHKTVYSFHSSSTLSDSFKNASVAGNKAIDFIDVTVIDTQALGSAQGIYVSQVAQAIKNKQSKNQVDVLVSKNQPLLFDIVILGELTSAIGPSQADTPVQTSIANQAIAFKPVITIDQGGLNVIDCVKDQAQANLVALDLLANEIQKRGGFVREIVVTYDFLYGEAIAMSNQLKDIYPKSIIQVNEAGPSLTGCLGRKIISLSVM